MPSTRPAHFFNVRNASFEFCRWRCSSTVMFRRVLGSCIKPRPISVILHSTYHFRREILGQKHKAERPPRDYSKSECCSRRSEIGSFQQFQHLVVVRWTNSLIGFEKLFSIQQAQHQFRPADQSPTTRMPPRDVACDICGGRFFPSSLPFHRKSCMQTYMRRQEQAAEEDPRTFESNLRQPAWVGSSSDAARRNNANNGGSYDSDDYFSFDGRGDPRDAPRISGGRGSREAKKRGYEPSYSSTSAPPGGPRRLPGSHPSHGTGTGEQQDVSIRAGSSRYDLNGAGAGPSNVPLSFRECRVCGRSFAPDRIGKHESVCQNAHKKRKVRGGFLTRGDGRDENLVRRCGNGRCWRHVVSPAAAAAMAYGTLPPPTSCTRKKLLPTAPDILSNGTGLNLLAYLRHGVSTPFLAAPLLTLLHLGGTNLSLPPWSTLAPLSIGLTSPRLAFRVLPHHYNTQLYYARKTGRGCKARQHVSDLLPPADKYFVDRTAMVVWIS